tara:strand:- start:359 stop:1519 length:1161 start_codon:yes stop_codon:yes gene_type:complete
MNNRNFFNDHKKLLCPINKSSKFKLLFKIKKFPIYMGTIKKKNKYKYQSMNFFINNSSGSVQIFPRIDLKKLYFKSHGSGKIGRVWEEHHKRFYKFLKLRKNSKLLEIGGGHNSLSINEELKKKNISLISFEPNKKKTKEKNFLNIKSFFNYNSILKYNLVAKFDMVVHSHLFEHIYQAETFLQAIHLSLKKNGKHVFAIPNMEPMVKRGIASAINFEHPFYLDQKSIDYLLKKNGFKIIEKKMFGNAHSIFYKTVKTTQDKNINFTNSFQKNIKIFKNLKNNWINDVKEINKKLSNKKNDIFLFEAHIFSQMLIFNGLNIKHISNILDNDNDKQGEYLYGTSLKVVSPDILKDILRPLVILRAGEYNKEIKDDIIKNINPNVEFV